MLGCVDFIVGPGVALAAGTATGDEASLSASCHHIVLENSRSGTSDVNTSIPVHTEAKVLEVCDGLSFGDQVANDPGTHAFIKNA